MFIQSTFLGLLVLLVSCQGLERSVDDSTMVPTTDLPTITSFICPQDTVLEVRVEKTLAATGSRPKNTFVGEPILGAQVTLSDGTTSVKLTQNLSLFGVYRISTPTLKIEAGKTYSLHVETPDHKVVSALCTIPLPSLNKNMVTLEKVSSVSQSLFSTVRVKWPDKANEVDYYALYHYYTSFRLGDQQVRSSYQGIAEYYEDKNIDGQYIISKPIDVQPDFFSKDSYSRNIFILCITDKIYYDYHQALASIKLNNDNPFADPVRVPTNIQGGYGIFSGYNRIEFGL